MHFSVILILNYLNFICKNHKMDKIYGAEVFEIAQGPTIQIRNSRRPNHKNRNIIHYVRKKIENKPKLNLFPI